MYWHGSISKLSWWPWVTWLQLKFTCWPVSISSLPVLLSAVVHNSMDYSSIFLPYERRRRRLSVMKGKGESGQIWIRHRVLWLEVCKATRGMWALRFQPGLLDGVWASMGANHADSFWAAPHSPVWKLVLLPRQRRERLFKRNILSFSLIHCSWRFGTLLLNCSCYGYQHLYQQPFWRLSPYSLHSQSQLPLPPFRGFCFIAASTISGLQMCSAQLTVQEQWTRIFPWNFYLLFLNKILCTLCVTNAFSQYRQCPLGLNLMFPACELLVCHSFLLLSFSLL